MADDLARRLDDLEKRIQQLEGRTLMRPYPPEVLPTGYAKPTDRFPTLHADRETPGAALGVVRERERNARLEGGDADDGA